jgi:hypothetical protein
MEINMDILDGKEAQTAKVLVSLYVNFLEKHNIDPSGYHTILECFLVVNSGYIIS